MTATTMTRAVAPERSLEQRRSALRQANHVRIHNADAKKDLKHGSRSITDILDDPTSHTMKIIDLLLAVPKVGRVKANKALQQARISPSKTLGGLTARQRDALIVELASYPVVRPFVDPAGRRR